MKSKKSSIIIQIICFSLLLVFLLLLLFVRIKGGSVEKFWSRSYMRNELLHETYLRTDVTKIKADLRATDIVFRKSQDDQIHVNVYGRGDKNTVTVMNDGGELKIGSSSDPWQFCFFICFNESKVEVSVPTSFQGDIAVETISGDVDSDKSLLFATAKVKTTSGDVQLGTVRDASIQTVSGEIELRRATWSLNLSSTSGDISVSSFKIGHDASVRTVSGDVSIKMENGCFVAASSVSGDKDIQVKDTGEYKLTISTTSGDIDVE